MILIVLCHSVLNNHIMVFDMDQTTSWYQSGENNINRLMTGNDWSRNQFIFGLVIMIYKLVDVL